MKKAILLGILFLSIGAVFAEEQVMIVSDLNTPDLFAATAAGSYEGVPVITLKNGELNENITSTLTEMTPEEVILIGGPAVISEEVENELEENYTIVRLWGMERTKTALQLAKYFWHQANCAVLVEDTKNPENDSTMQTEALTEASLNECPLIPVPRGAIPAEVLETLNELDINEIRYIGRQINQEIKDSLQGFNLTEVIGELREIRNQVIARALDKANAMVIIATPHWNETHGIGGALNNNSVVRRVVTMEDMPDVITLIQDNNLSPIKVVGNPLLAGQVVNELENNDITAYNYAGPNAAATARKIWRAERNKFIAKKAIRTMVKNNVVSERAAHVRRLLNDSQSALDELEAEIEELNAEGMNTTELEEQLTRAELMLEQAEGNVTVNQATAKRLLTKALNMVKQRMWRNRQVLQWNWQEKLRDEIHSKAQIINRLRIATVEGNLTRYTNACGSAEEIQALVNKAKELKNEAAAEEDPAAAASLLKEAKRNIDQARSLGKICMVKKAIPQKLKNAVTKRIQRVNAKKTRVIQTARRILNRVRNNN